MKSANYCYVRNILLAFIPTVRIMRALPLQGGTESIVF